MTALERIANGTQRLKLSARDFWALDEAGAFTNYARTELIEGEIWVVNALHTRHGRAHSELGAELVFALRQLDAGLVALVAPSTELSDDSIPEPDLAVALDSADKTLQGGNVRIAIEISDSTLAFDLGRKAALYARHAIPEYWVVDLESRVIHQHSAANAEGYADKRAVSFGTAIASVAVPGLIVPTDTLPR